MEKQIAGEIGEAPLILRRHVSEFPDVTPEYLPRRVRRRFHGQDVTLWQGFVRCDDVQGYAENIRLKFYLNKWRANRGGLDTIPTSEDIYNIMYEADQEETKDSKKPFHVERMAESISKNGIQEPIILFYTGDSKAELWDGNRRFYGTMHIMKALKFKDNREQSKWLPALVVTPSGDPAYDQKLKHAVLTELNFIEKDAIPWPAYVKAEQIYIRFKQMTAADPTDPTLSRLVKEQLAKEYGLRGWRQADRWIKMYELALQFKEYHEEEHSRTENEVDLKIQEKFEYFDELSKPGVWGPLAANPDARDDVFNWLWDGKFHAWTFVRSIPKILSDPVARRIANEPDLDAVKRAIDQTIINDPTRIKDKEAANEKIAHFAEWLDTFKREDFKQLNAASLSNLNTILVDVVKILSGLQETSIKVEG